MFFEQLEVNWSIFSYIAVIIGGIIIRLCPIIIPMMIIYKKAKDKKIKILGLCIWPFLGSIITYFSTKVILIDMIVLVISLMILSIKLVLLFIKRIKTYKTENERKTLCMPIILSVLLVLFISSLLTVSYKNKLELERHARRATLTNSTSTTLPTL